VKITKSQFKQIIKEEILYILSGYNLDDLSEAHEPEALKRLGLLRRQRAAAAAAPASVASPQTAAAGSDPLEGLLNIKREELSEKQSACQIRGGRLGECDSYNIALLMITTLQNIHKAYGASPPLALHDLVNAVIAMDSADISLASLNLLNKTPDKKIKDQVDANISAIESWLNQLSKTPARGRN